MTLPVEVNPLLTGGGGSGYNISRSVRLRSSASAYLSRTFVTPTNNKIWTDSVWVKRGTMGTEQEILNANSVNAQFYFSPSNTLNFYDAASGATYYSTQVFRDPSAWYHIVISVDTTQATASNRVRIYVNGSQITAFSSGTAPSQNTASSFNTTSTVHTIGRYNPTTTNYFDGYLTEINFIDGQALTPSSFGGYNSVTGGWEARKYTGTYGTNGFRLNFSDNSAATAAAIGKDSSGNGNNWTPNNISLTAGVTYDSMLDVPTMWADGGNGRGNYATLNPVGLHALAAYTLSNGNLQLNTNGGSMYNCTAFSTIAITSGKWYAEFVENVQGGSLTDREFIGISRQVSIGNAQSTPNDWNLYSTYYVQTALVKDNVTFATVSMLTLNDIVGVAYDADNSTCAFYKNGVLVGTVTGIVPGTYHFSCQGYSANSITANFGQRPFSYTPPSGFKALHTGNLPAPAITKPNKNFDVSLYTGTGAAQSITNAGGFAPDLVWIKSRSAARSHRLQDVIRGVGNRIASDLPDTEVADASSLTSFNPNGFSLGTNINYNNSAEPYAGWQWKAGGTAVSNTAGTITSQVSANASAGFSVVTYTGTGANATVGHGLGVAPKMVITKGRDSVAGLTNWTVYHSSVGNTGAIFLNLTNATLTSSTQWNNTSPTSSAFSIGTSGDKNANTGTYVAYCFSEIAGYSKMGSYIGNGSNDGPFVYLGFKPKFLLIKNSTTAATNWEIWDTSRDVSNVLTNRLFPDLNSAESGGQNAYDFLSNGFKSRQAGSTDSNQSGATIIYIAFAETPFKNALAR